MKRIVSDKAPAALGPYVQAVDTGSTVYCSGQLGLDPATGVLPEGVVAQTHQSLKNLQAVLAEAGLTLDNVVKTTSISTSIPPAAACRSPPCPRVRWWRSSASPHAVNITNNKALPFGRALFLFIRGLNHIILLQQLLHLGAFNLFQGLFQRQLAYQRHLHVGDLFAVAQFHGGIQ